MLELWSLREYFIEFPLDDTFRTIRLEPAWEEGGIYPGGSRTRDFPQKRSQGPGRAQSLMAE